MQQIREQNFSTVQKAKSPGEPSEAVAPTRNPQST